MNVAKLKYEFDSSEAVKAKKDLDSQTRAAKDAEKAQKGLASSSTKAGRSMAAANENVTRSTNKARDAKGRYLKTTKAADIANKSFTGGLGKMGSAFGLVGAAITAALAVLTAFLTAVVAGTRNALSFARSLIEVATLSQDAKQNIDFINDAASDLSNRFGGPAIAQVQAFYQAISAGAGTAQEANALLIDANKLAVGGVTDVATGVDVLTTATNAYGKANLTTKAAADAIFVAVQQGKTTVNELASSLGNVVPIASSLGVEFDELLAAAAALTTQGQTTATAFTGIRAILSGVAKPTSEAAKLANQLGIEFNTAGLKAKGLNGFLEEVIQKTGGSKEALAQLFGSVEALNAVFAFAGGAGEKFNSTLEAMANKSGAADDAFNTVSDSLSGRYNKAVSKLSNSFLEIGERILPLVVTALELLASGMQSVSNFIVDAIDRMKVKFEFYADVVGAIFSNIPSAIAIGVIATLDFMVNTVKSGLNQLLRPVNSLIEGLNYISGKNFKPIQIDDSGTNFQGVLDSLGGQAGVGAKAYQEAIAKRDLGLQIIANRRADFGVTADDGYLDDTTTAFETVTASATKAGTAISKAANDNVDPWKGLRKVTKAANDNINMLQQTTSGFFQQWYQGVRRGKSVWESFKTAGLDTLNALIRLRTC